MHCFADDRGRICLRAAGQGPGAAWVHTDEGWRALGPDLELSLGRGQIPRVKGQVVGPSSTAKLVTGPNGAIRIQCEGNFRQLMREGVAPELAETSVPDFEGELCVLFGLRPEIGPGAPAEAEALHSLTVDECELEILRLPAPAGASDLAHLWRQAFQVSEINQMVDAKLPVDDAAQLANQLCHIETPCDRPGVYALATAVDLGYGQDMVATAFGRLDARGRWWNLGRGEVQWREYHCQPEFERSGQDTVSTAPPHVEGAGPDGECDPEGDADCMIGCFTGAWTHREIRSHAGAWYELRATQREASGIGRRAWAPVISWDASRPKQAPTACKN